MKGELIRVRGTVQGVGFRPTVARLAQEKGLCGFVRNDGEGVLIGLAADTESCDRFVTDLLAELPPLALVAAVERLEMNQEQKADLAQFNDFCIEQSALGPPRTAVPADAKTCLACQREVRDPENRRFRYPFNSCTHCGPRFSIVQGLPLDRDHTTMAQFELCPECRQEYDDPQNRRYHAQATACHRCGPKATLRRSDGKVFDYFRYSMLDEVDAAGALLRSGELLALKGLGGYQLCCDATNHTSVQTLRARKGRPHRPLALMFRDLDVLRRYAHVSDLACALLQSPAAPIVLLPKRAVPDAEWAPELSPAIAPDQPTIGCMLPYTPMHQLVLARLDRPIVCTSGNLTDLPPCIDDEDAFHRLSQIADWFLVHDRTIEHRVDDSVVTIMSDVPRVMRRARGYAPATLQLPEGLEHAPPVLAMGSDLKNTFTLTRSGEAVISPHLGDLDNIQALHDYRQHLDLLARLYEHSPSAVAVDAHPNSRASEVGRALARERNLPLIQVQHHHAHIAACLAENQWPMHAPPVLGIALDGVGYGDDGCLWGGEFLVASYQSFQRVATLKPIRLLGGDRAAREPWRCLYAHLRADMGWSELHSNYGDIEAVQSLWSRSVNLLDHMLETGLSSPLVTSTGRLFDAVAAALGIYREGLSFEGQAAMALEALVTPERLQATDAPYVFSIAQLPPGDLPYLDPRHMWRALLGDLWAGVHREVIATRFHRGLAQGIVHMAERLRRSAQGPAPLDTIALSGGVFQNRVLFELVTEGLQAAGFRVLTHRSLPPNDGGVALGQAAVAASRLLNAR